MLLDISWRLARPLLFQLDAEDAHHLVISAVGNRPRLARALLSTLASQPVARPVSCAGMQLGGRVGLAAGLDKDAVALPVWEAMGFGFIEVGTVTPRPQSGNPLPRLHRVLPERGLINRMGFNNDGVDAMAARLGAWQDSGLWPRVPVGANIGRNKSTPNERAADDYCACVRKLRRLVDWFTVNVSSPNTPALRALLQPAPLRQLLDAVVAEAGGVPVFLKLSPDLEPEALRQVVEVAVQSGCSGLIATNTTVSRPGATGRDGLPGGLSGRPLWPLARRQVAVAVDAARGRVPVWGVGGVDSAGRAAELVGLGCAAVQLYSGLIFEGPGLPARIARGLALLERRR